MYILTYFKTTNVEIPTRHLIDVSFRKWREKEWDGKVWKSKENFNYIFVGTFKEKMLLSITYVVFVG
jgi:hypothetical protein